MLKETVNEKDLLRMSKRDIIVILDAIVADEDKDYSFFLDVFERMRKQSNEYVRLVKEGKIQGE